jgi:iron complex transport system ATP-binding protein
MDNTVTKVVGVFVRFLTSSITIYQLLEIQVVRRTLIFLGSLAAADRAAIDEGSMIDFELLIYSTASFPTLSDGQLQRALIARALVQQTEYI